jgi:hypothetical protein
LLSIFIGLYLSLEGVGDDDVLEVVDLGDEEGTVFEAHCDIGQVLSHELDEDVLVEAAVELARLLDIQVEFGDDDGHKTLTEDVAVVVHRNLGQVVEAQDVLLVGDVCLESFLELNVLVRELFGDGLVLLFLLVDSHIVGLDKLEAVEEEVDTLGVVVANLAIHAILANANSGPLVVLVECREDRLVIVVDEDVGLFLDVLLDVDLVHRMRDGAQGLFDPARVVTEAGEGSEELLVAALHLTLEVAEVHVASATEQGELALVVGVEDLEPRHLLDTILGQAEGKAEGVVLEHRRHDLLVAGELAHKRRRDVVGRGFHIDVAAVVEGPNVVDEGPIEDLEVDFGVLEDKLVGVAGVEHLSQWRHCEGRRRAVDLAEALVEELADRLVADPVVVVGVDGPVGREPPVVAVEVRTNQRTTQVLGGDDVALEIALIGSRELVGLGVAEAEEGVVVLAEDGTNGLLNGGTELEGLVGVDGVVTGGNDDVRPVVVEHTAVLGDEVVADVLEAGEGQGADVVDDVRHGWFGLGASNVIRKGGVP